MDFRIPDEITALRASFASFLDREVRPVDEEVREVVRRIVEEANEVLARLR